MKYVILTLGFMFCICLITSVSGTLFTNNTVYIARGDNLSFSIPSIGMGEYMWLWIFHDLSDSRSNYYLLDKNVSVKHKLINSKVLAEFTLNRSEVESLDTGLYHVYVQSVGGNHIKEVYYNESRKEIRTIYNYEYSGLKPVNIDAKPTTLINQTLHDFIAQSDDWLEEFDLVVENPWIKLTSRDVHENSDIITVIGTTNLDNTHHMDIWVDNGLKFKFFTYISQTSNQSSNYWSYDMPLTKDEMAPGIHTVYIKSDTGQLLTTTFRVNVGFDKPTPIPTTQKTYSIIPDEGFATPVPTPVPIITTPTPEVTYAVEIVTPYIPTPVPTPTPLPEQPPSNYNYLIILPIVIFIVVAVYKYKTQITTIIKEKFKKD